MSQNTTNEKTEVEKARDELLRNYVEQEKLKANKLKTETPDWKRTMYKEVKDSLRWMVEKF